MLGGESGVEDNDAGGRREGNDPSEMCQARVKKGESEHVE
jgi:hypothetical protein